MKLPAIAGAAALALGAGVLIGGGLETPAANAQGSAANFSVSPQQLLINQRISIAAVKRAREALGRLDALEPRVAALEARLAAPGAAVAGVQGAQGSQGEQGPKGDEGEPGQPGAQGDPGIADPLTDGPFPGETQLKGPPPDGALDGDRNDGRENSTDQWTNDGTMQSSWVRCGNGRVAIGGGFGVGTSSVAFNDLNVVMSAPALIDENGDILSETAAASVGVDVDNGDFAFRPNGWLVRGFYNAENGVKNITVRPFVTCATVNE